MKVTETIKKMYEAIDRDIENFKDDCKKDFFTVNEENGKEIYWYYDGDDSTEIKMEVPENEKPEVKMVYVVEEYTKTSDVFTIGCAWSLEEAKKIADSDLAHLTDREAKTRTIGIYGYNIPVRDDDPFNAYLEEEELGGADFYEEFFTGEDFKRW